MEEFESKTHERHDGSGEVEALNIERKLQDLRDTMDDLLEAFEQSGLSRDYKGKCCKRTLAENLDLTYYLLRSAYESPHYDQSLSDHLFDLYMDIYEYEDHFTTYYHENGKDLDPDGAMFSVRFEAQNLATLILAKHIREWSSKNTAELKQFQDDLLTRLREDLKRATVRVECW